MTTQEILNKTYGFIGVHVGKVTIGNAIGQS